MMDKVVARIRKYWLVSTLFTTVFVVPLFTGVTTKAWAVQYLLPGAVFGVLALLVYGAFAYYYYRWDQRWAVLCYHIDPERRSKRGLGVARLRNFPDVRLFRSSGEIWKWSADQSGSRDHYVNNTSPYEHPTAEGLVIVGVFDVHKVQGIQDLCRAFLEFEIPERIRKVSGD